MQHTSSKKPSADMTIEIEIDAPEPFERKKEYEDLLRYLNAKASEHDDVSSDRHGVYLLVSGKALPFLVSAISAIELRGFSYKFRVDGVEGAAVWKRSFQR